MRGSGVDLIGKAGISPNRPVFVDIGDIPLVDVAHRDLVRQLYQILIEYSCNLEDDIKAGLEKAGIKKAAGG